MKQLSCAVLLVALSAAASCSAQADAGEVAYAAPPVAEQASDSVACAAPCYVVESRWPFKTCKAECNPDVCNRGHGVYQSNEICCSPGVTFPDGCSSRPSQCWVVESFALRTCVRDDRKCLQGYGVFASEEACCAPTAAFPDGCGNVTKAAEPCWVVDTYYPTRQCRQSRTLCSTEAGVQSFATKEACCATNGGAFAEGCSTYTPPVPCWIVAEPQFPNRTCKVSNDAAVCNRGWKVFQSAEVCCAPGAGFNEGCSQQPSPEAAAAAPEAAAAAPEAAAAAPEAAAAAAAPEAAVPAAIPAPTPLPATSAAVPVAAAAPAAAAAAPASIPAPTPLPATTAAAPVAAAPATPVAAAAAAPGAVPVGVSTQPLPPVPGTAGHK